MLDTRLRDDGIVLTLITVRFTRASVAMGDDAWAPLAVMAQEWPAPRWATDPGQPAADLRDVGASLVRLRFQ